MSVPAGQQIEVERWFGGVHIPPDAAAAHEAARIGEMSREHRAGLEHRRAELERQERSKARRLQSLNDLLGLPRPR